MLNCKSEGGWIRDKDLEVTNVLSGKWMWANQSDRARSVGKRMVFGDTKS